ncbi:MAG: response regulator transcription factor [Gemmatimonadales bacterium]
MTNLIKVLIADDHAILRAGLESLLSAESDMEVVGHAATGDEAVTGAQTLHPDVVVMDLSMPGSGGLEATRRILALDLDTRVLVLTMHEEEEYLVPVLEAGASGYLTKTTADRALIDSNWVNA